MKENTQSTQTPRIYSKPIHHIQQHTKNNHSNQTDSSKNYFSHFLDFFKKYFKEKQWRIQLFQENKNLIPELWSPDLPEEHPKYHLKKKELKTKYQYLGLDYYGLIFPIIFLNGMIIPPIIFRKQGIKKLVFLILGIESLIYLLFSYPFESYLITNLGSNDESYSQYIRDSYISTFPGTQKANFFQKINDEKALKYYIRTKDENIAKVKSMKMNI